MLFVTMLVVGLPWGGLGCGRGEIHKLLKGECNYASYCGNQNGGVRFKAVKCISIK